MKNQISIIKFEVECDPTPVTISDHKARGVVKFRHPVFGEITTALSPNGVMLAKANDVARALGFNYPAQAVIRHCKHSMVYYTPTPGGLQPTKFLGQMDILYMAMRSCSPYADDFIDWYEGDLRNLRKTIVTD